MKAWRIGRHGGVEELKYLDISAPLAEKNEVRIKVEAVGLNQLDIWVRKGVSGHHFPLPITPGCDIAGTIDQIGIGSEKFLAERGLVTGSPVVLSPGTSCGECEHCKGGFDPLCRKYGILGETRDGGCAEYIVVPVENVVGRPIHIDAITAAAVPIAYLTAFTMLYRKAKLKPGETVLVQAGGSGVSVACIQLAKMTGATVVTTVGSKEKADQARALGADHVILYREQNLREEAKTYLATIEKKGFDVAIDHVGADTFDASLRLLTWGGRLVTCGATSGPEVKLDLRIIFFKNISILGSTMGGKQDFIEVMKLVGAGKLKPVVDSIYPMLQLADAHMRLESRQAFGKVMLKV
ncbi:MAG: zinc-binding dehydrogenase [Bdellovibrionota bacterium]